MKWYWEVQREQGPISSNTTLQSPTRIAKKGSSKDYKYPKTRQKRVRQADARSVPINMTGWQKDGERESRTGVKGSKRRLKGWGGGLDADAPLHILTFRSLCTMSCWWMWWTLSRIWWIQWLWRQNREEGQLVVLGGWPEGGNWWWAQKDKGGAEKRGQGSRDVHARVRMRWKIQRVKWHDEGAEKMGGDGYRWRRQEIQ